MLRKPCARQVFSAALSSVAIVIALAATMSGCGDDPPPPPSTNSLATALGEQLLPTAAPRCTDAFAAGPPADNPAQGSVSGPGLALIQSDFSRLEERYRERNPPLTEWRNRDLSFLASIFPYRALATSADAVQTLVCVRQIYNLVGHYDKNNIPAVRIDWDVRVLSWPSGAQLAGATFQGPDPPATADVALYGSCTGASDACATKSGGDPHTPAYKWLDGLIAR